MKPVKVVFTVNGSFFVCSTPEQLESFLSSGWEVYKEPPSITKGAASPKKKNKAKEAV